MEYIVVALVAMLAYQQWFLTRQIQLLVDKLMSRNYAEYVQVRAPAEQSSFALPPQEPLEDLGPLNGIQLR